MSPPGSDPDFRVAGLSVWIEGREFEDVQDYWDGNWLKVVATCASPGAKVEAAGPILHLSEVASFLGECQTLSERLEGAAQLDCMEGNLQVSLEFSDGQGNIEASISLTPDPLTEEHAFVFAIDQSHLPFILRGLQAVLERFPIRGTPD